jgi:hypothetical protein
MPMTREQAELAVDRDERLRRLGPNREASIQILMRFNPEEIPNRMPAGSPLVRNVTRQTAISAAMGGPEEPRMVTPATPAPVRPGIPIMAPRPEARSVTPDDARKAAAPEMAAPEEVPAPTPAAAPAPAAPKSSYVSPARIAAEQSKRELDILNYNRAKTPEGSPLLADIDVAIDLTERRIAQQESIANAEESAKIDADREAVFARQEGRLKGRGEQVERDEKDAYADALIKGGLALMNPRRGNNFLAALSEGLGQGLETYDTTKTKAIEARARLGAETDALALQKIDALTQARAAARQAILEGKQLDEQGLRMKNLTDEAIVNIGTRQARVEEKIANARKATTEADYAPRMFESELGVNAARAVNYLTGDGGSGGSGGKPASATTVLEETGKSTRELPELRTKASDAFYKVQKEKDPVKKAQLQGQYEIARDNYRRARDRLASLEGRPTGSPYRRSVTGEVYTGPRRTGAAAPAGPKSTKPKGFPGTQAAWDVMTPAEKKLFQ